jgi:hypothetical protein
MILYLLIGLIAIFLICAIYGLHLLLDIIHKMFKDDKVEKTGGRLTK